MHRYFGAYMRPFHVTPLPDITRNADVIIIAANTAAPKGVVKAYQGEISIRRAARTRVWMRYAHRIKAWPMTAAAIHAPPLRNQDMPSKGQTGRNNAAINATSAPNTPSSNNDG